jgi:hypothetical protein
MDTETEDDELDAEPRRRFEKAFATEPLTEEQLQRIYVRAVTRGKYLIRRRRIFRLTAAAVIGIAMWLFFRS